MFYNIEGFNLNDVLIFFYDFVELYEKGVNYIVLLMWMLVVVEDGKIVLFVYIKKVKVVGFKLIIWILECFGFLVNGGGWYF